jgi:hypothetical protein
MYIATTVQLGQRSDPRWKYRTDGKRELESANVNVSVSSSLFTHTRRIIHMATATKSTAKKSTAVKTVTFAKVKLDYIAHRNIDSTDVKASNAYKGMRQFIRDNKVKLVNAGWTELADHQHAAPYGNVPVKVATMIVNRKVAE